jgi:hypothetical protein
MEEKRIRYRLLEGEPEFERSLGRPRLRRVDRIKIDLGEREGERERRMPCCGLGWCESGYGQMENSCECGNEPFCFHKMLGNYRVATQLVASRIVLSFIE